jgi:hypothetical protein
MSKNLEPNVDGDWEGKVDGDVDGDWEGKVDGDVDGDWLFFPFPELELPRERLELLRERLELKVDWDWESSLDMITTGWGSSSERKGIVQKKMLSTKL